MGARSGWSKTISGDYPLESLYKIDREVAMDMGVLKHKCDLKVFFALLEDVIYSKKEMTFHTVRINALLRSLDVFLQPTVSLLPVPTASLTVWDSREIFVSH